MLDPPRPLRHISAMKLETYLLEKGLTEAQFASLIGRSQSAVHRIKKQKRKPDWETLQRIVDATNGAVTPNDFLVEQVPSEAAQ